MGRATWVFLFVVTSVLVIAHDLHVRDRLIEAERQIAALEMRLSANRAETALVATLPLIPRDAGEALIERYEDVTQCQDDACRHAAYKDVVERAAAELERSAKDDRKDLILSLRHMLDRM